MIYNFFIRRLQYNDSAWRFFITIGALGFVIDGVYGVLLNLYLLRLGYDARFIGQVNSFGLLTFALVSLPAGILGTRWTSSQMLRIGSGSALLGAFLLPLGEFSPETWREFWFTISYALVLTGYSLFFVNGAPFLMSVVEREKQSSAFAFHTAILALAAFGGSFLSGNVTVLIANLHDFTLDDPQPYRYTLLLSSLVVLAALLITLTIKEQLSEYDNRLLSLDANPIGNIKRGGFTTAVIAVIGVMSLVRFLQVGGVATVSIYINIYLDTKFNLSPSIIGIIASIGRLLAVPTVLLAPRLARRVGEGTVAMWASFTTGLCLLPIALIPQWWTAALGYIGVVMLSNLRFTTFIVYIMMLVPKRHQPVMAGAGEAAAGLSFAIIALGGGYIVTSSSFSELFLLGATLCITGSLIFGLHLRSVQVVTPREIPSVP